MSAKKIMLKFNLQFKILVYSKLEKYSTYNQFLCLTPLAWLSCTMPFFQQKCHTYVSTNGFEIVGTSDKTHGLYSIYKFCLKKIKLIIIHTSEFVNSSRKCKYNYYYFVDVRLYATFISIEMEMVMVMERGEL